MGFNSLFGEKLRLDQPQWLEFCQIQSINLAKKKDFVEKACIYCTVVVANCTAFFLCSNSVFCQKGLFIKIVNTFQSEVKGIGGEKTEHLGFNKNNFFGLGFFLRKMKIPCLRLTCRNTHIFNSLIQSVNQKERRDLLCRVTRHLAGLEKQLKPFVGAELPQGPAVSFLNSPLFIMGKQVEVIRNGR